VRGVFRLTLVTTESGVSLNHAESGEPSAGQRIGEERTEGLRVTNPKTMEGLVQLLSDEYSRKIAMSAVSKAKSVEELSQEDNVPLSTCYRRVHELVDSGIMIIERIVITPEGRKYELFRSAYKGMQINFEDGNVTIDATVNQDISDKLYKLWVSMRP